MITRCRPGCRIAQSTGWPCLGRRAPAAAVADSVGSDAAAVQHHQAGDGRLLSAMGGGGDGEFTAGSDSINSWKGL
eukprot:SAG31_NODE_40612_length_280_cov_0.569061_1_plen_75_part_10